MRLVVGFLLSLIMILLLTGCDQYSPGYMGFINETGQTYGIQQIDNRPRVSSMPYLYDISEGNVPGHEPWLKVGFSPSSTATESTVWELATQYIWPVVAQQMEVVSTSANDTALGNGARSVGISYLDGNYVEHFENLTLNGLGVVPTGATDIFRVNYFVVTSVGITGKAEGIIDIRNLANTPIYSEIAAGYNRARNIVYTVPLGRTLYVTSIAFSAGHTVSGRRVRFTTQATYDHVRDVWLGPNFFMPYSEVVLTDSAYTKELERPTKLSEKTDLKVSIIGETLAWCTTSLRGWLEVN